ncbi:DUF2336 domain-containing protein [Rhodovibrionaceae bacterium A322]
MPELSMRLNMADAHRLMMDPSAESRQKVMSKILAEIDGSLLGDEERQLALQVIEKFAVDTEVQVRVALARQIANSPYLRRDLAEKLARDVAEVAVPVLVDAKVLSQDFLIGIVGEGDRGKQEAVAQRRDISFGLANSLVESNNSRAVELLMRNGAADLSEEIFIKTMDRYPDYEPISFAMIERDSLPAVVIEKLVYLVSEELREELMERHQISAGLSKELVRKAREAATVPLIKPISAKQKDIERLVRHLHSSSRLSASLLFRALCSGELDFFKVGMAKRADIPSEEAQGLFEQHGPDALIRLFAKAGLSRNLIAPFTSAMMALQELDYLVDSATPDRHTLQVSVLSRVFKDCGATEDPLVDELLSQLVSELPNQVVEEAMEKGGIPFLPF